MSRKEHPGYVCMVDPEAVLSIDADSEGNVFVKPHALIDVLQSSDSWQFAGAKKTEVAGILRNGGSQLPMSAAAFEAMRASAAGEECWSEPELREYIASDGSYSYAYVYYMDLPADESGKSTRLYASQDEAGDFSYHVYFPVEADYLLQQYLYNDGAMLELVNHKMVTVGDDGSIKQTICENWNEGFKASADLGILHADRQVILYSNTYNGDSLKDAVEVAVPGIDVRVEDADSVVAEHEKQKAEAVAYAAYEAECARYEKELAEYRAQLETWKRHMMSPQSRPEFPSMTPAHSRVFKPSARQLRAIKYRRDHPPKGVPAKVVASAARTSQTKAKPKLTPLQVASPVAKATPDTVALPSSRSLGSDCSVLLGSPVAAATSKSVASTLVDSVASKVSPASVSLGGYSPASSLMQDKPSPSSQVRPRTAGAVTAASPVAKKKKKKLVGDVRRPSKEGARRSKPSTDSRSRQLGALKDKAGSALAKRGLGKGVGKYRLSENKYGFVSGPMHGYHVTEDGRQKHFRRGAQKLKPMDSVTCRSTTLDPMTTGDEGEKFSF